MKHTIIRPNLLKEMPKDQKDLIELAIGRRELVTLIGYTYTEVTDFLEDELGWNDVELDTNGWQHDWRQTMSKMDDEDEEEISISLGGSAMESLKINIEVE